MAAIRMLKEKDSLNYIVFQTKEVAIGKNRKGDETEQLVVAGGHLHVHKSYVGDAEEIELVVVKKKEPAGAETTDQAKKRTSK